MTTSAPSGPGSSSKKRRGGGASSTTKRTRTSPPADDAPASLRGGSGSFSPAAGTWQPTTGPEPGPTSPFPAGARVPLGAALGIPSPSRPPTSAPRALGAQRGLGLFSPSPSPLGPHPRGKALLGQRDLKTPTVPRQEGTLPTPDTVKRLRSRHRGTTPPLPRPPPPPPPPSTEPGPEEDWSYPDPRWNTDRQIIDGWKALEGLIASYVNDIIVDSIPDIDTTHLVYPYEAFFRLSNLAIPMVRNVKYAKYVFQLSLWNILDVKFLSHMATEWACEEKGRSHWGQRTKGLAAAMDLLTYDHSMNPNTTILRREREKWYMWRKDTVDIAYGWLSSTTDFEQTINNAIFDILSMYQGHFKAEFAGGDRDSWDNLVWRTTEIVTAAAQLSIMMRRSEDGTWSPFIPIRLVDVRPESMMRHQDTTASFPAGQTKIRHDSKVTMTVVPGLCKYEMTNVAEDPEQPGEQNTAIRKKVRIKAKCLIDITEAETGALRDGDIWVPEDI